MEAIVRGVAAENAMREIRAEMARQHISQRELAERLSWTQTYLWRRLAGRTPISLDDIELIAAALGSSILQLCWHRTPIGRERL